jgi:hypothetical protein
MGEMTEQKLLKIKTCRKGLAASSAMSEKTVLSWGEGGE